MRAAAGLAFSIVGLVFLSPLATSESPPPAGHAQLLDPSGDVTYAPEYVGPRDRVYLDLEEARFEYGNETDSILLRVQILDTRPLQALAPNRALECRLDANVSVEDPNSETSVSYVWAASHDRAQIASSVGWGTMPSAGIARGGRYGLLEHEFFVDFREHGSVQFRVPRAPLLQLGDELRGVTVRCDEWFEPPYAHGPAFIQRNSDKGTGSGSFNLARLEPAAKVSVPEPWETGPEWIAPAIGLGLLVRLVVAWWLYARIDRHDVLKNKTRGRVFDLVQQNPGIRQRELMRLSDLSWGALVHHLRTLEANGLIKKLQFHGFASYITAETDSKKALPAAALRTPTARWIFEEIQRRPGLTAGQLARERHVHASSISFHVRRLIDAGLLIRTRTRAGLELRAAEASGVEPADVSAASASRTDGA